MSLPESVLGLLRANPETVMVTIGGVERPFLLSVLGCEMATAKGHDPIPPLVEAVTDVFSGLTAGTDAPAGEALQSLGKELQSGKLSVGGLASTLSTQTLSRLVPVLWAGLLPFEPTLTLDVLKATLTPTGIIGVIRAAGAPIMAFAKDALPSNSAPTAGEGVAEGKPEGKPEGRPSRSRPARSGAASTASAG